MWLLRREVSAEAVLLAMARAYRRNRASGKPRRASDRAAPRLGATPGAPLPLSRTIFSLGRLKMLRDHGRRAVSGPDSDDREGSGTATSTRSFGIMAAVPVSR